ncbi:MAG: histidine kinase dimerization/phospho-acceptor domain-containing protein, partial [Alphaproteobacteria bacterium]
MSPPAAADPSPRHPTSSAAADPVSSGPATPGPATSRKAPPGAGARPEPVVGPAVRTPLAALRLAWRLGLPPALAVATAGLLGLVALALTGALRPAQLGPAVLGLAIAATLFALWLGRGRARLLTWLDALAAVARAPADRQAAVIPPPPPTGSRWSDRLARRIHRLHRDMIAADSRRPGLTQAGKAVFDALPDPLILLNAELGVVGANTAARRLFGGDSSGRLAAFLRNPQVLDAAHDALTDRIASQVRFTVPVPTERIFTVAVVPLTSDSPDGASAILALHDTTAAERMDAMRADFVANVSHELRTPLASLAGFVETLRGPARNDDKARMRFLGLMADQTSRMTRLVDDLLSLSRIEMHEHSPPTGRLDLRATARQVAGGLEMKARGRD